jgi:restriction system protein
MLLDLKRLFDLWTEHYPRIPEQQRRLLPLRPVYYLAPDEAEAG